MRLKTNMYKFTINGGAKPIETNNVDLRNSVMCYEIAKEEIEAGYVDRLAHDLRIAHDNPMALGGPGKVIFMVGGYDRDQRELWEIPEFVRFVRKAEEAKLCWLYFSDTDSGWINVLFATRCEGSLPVIREGQMNLIPVDMEIIQATIDRQAEDFRKLCRIAGLRNKAASHAFHKVVKAVRK
jgi:hypothetical protein